MRMNSVFSAYRCHPMSLQENGVMYICSDNRKTHLNVSPSFQRDGLSAKVQCLRNFVTFIFCPLSFNFHRKRAKTTAIILFGIALRFIYYNKTLETLRFRTATVIPIQKNWIITIYMNNLDIVTNGCISIRNKCNFKLGSAELFPNIKPMSSTFKTVLNWYD
jgi:hypothetical protein